MTEDLKRMAEMREKLTELGASEEDILKLFKIALETVDKIVKE